MSHPDQRSCPLIGANRQAKGEIIPAKRRTQHHFLISVWLQPHQFLSGLNYWGKGAVTVVIAVASSAEMGQATAGLASCGGDGGESNSARYRKAAVSLGNISALIPLPISPYEKQAANFRKYR
jgi:hypothetical protein